MDLLLTCNALRIFPVMNEFKRLFTVLLTVLQIAIICVWLSVILLFYVILVCFFWSDHFRDLADLKSILILALEPSIIYFSGLISEIVVLNKLIEYLRNNCLQKKDYIIFTIALLIEICVVVMSLYILFFRNS